MIFRPKISRCWYLEYAGCSIEVIIHGPSRFLPVGPDLHEFNALNPVGIIFIPIVTSSMFATSIGCLKLMDGNEGRTQSFSSQ